MASKGLGPVALGLVHHDRSAWWKAPVHFKAGQNQSDGVGLQSQGSDNLFKGVFPKNQLLSA